MINDQSARIQSLEIKATADGSSTLFVPELNEHYHSVHGALQESKHVFIEAGLRPLLQQNLPEIKIFEVGFGTGLNAILTFAEAEAASVPVLYDTIEAFPLPEHITAALNLRSLLQNDSLSAAFTQMHAAPWNKETTLSQYFRLNKRHDTLQGAILPPSEYNLIYFDAFAPEKQPELWTEVIFGKIFAAMQPEGILVTYCAKGIIKRMLRATGFMVETIPGPPGKREMIRAHR